MIRPLQLGNKKGDFTGMLFLIVSIAAFAIFILIVGYIGNTLSDEMKEKLKSDTPEVNQSFQTTKDISNNTLSALWYVVFGGLLIGLFVTAWKIPTNPIMVPAFIILLVVAVIIGVAMSNAYEELGAVSQFSSISSTQTSVSFFINNLPYIALVIGVIALIITFAKPGSNSAPIG